MSTEYFLASEVDVFANEFLNDLRTLKRLIRYSGRVRKRSNMTLI